MHLLPWVLLLAASPQHADTVEQALLVSRAMPERPGQVAISTAVASSQILPVEKAGGVRVPLSIAMGVTRNLDLRIDAFLTQLDGSVEKANLAATLGGIRVGGRMVLARNADSVVSLQTRVGFWAGVAQQGGLLPAFDLQLRAAGHAGPLVVDGGIGATLVSLSAISAKIKLGLVPVPEAYVHAGLAVGPVVLGAAVEGGLVDDIDAAGVFAGPEIQILAAGRVALTGFVSLTSQRAASLSLRVDLGR